MEKLWTISEVAQFLGITDADVEELVRQGQLTGYKLGGQFLRFRPQQVEVVKSKLRFRQVPNKHRAAHPSSRLGRVKDFFYFYDFYIVSATLLAIVVVYLIVAG
ncbi:MAG: helix-turn-helix domain-containing protein [Candidatus Omnitrophica bacterium]|nr:helix-turn-helix domain-containing protein [Candidatus Omnitrophota bacterium]